MLNIEYRIIFFADFMTKILKYPQKAQRYIIGKVASGTLDKSAYHIRQRP